ncbi:MULTISPECIES: substrate-binding periplasmic protein [Marinobacter]|uniref:substrate-binding periplasmic protein n=1 Tax=Marinobacter TaxID=2742 RepID=UPI0026065690|nr:ABC transporter substrate-binding protein [Marinobacter sp. F26243]
MNGLRTFLLALLFCSGAAFAENTLKVRVTDFPPNYHLDSQGRWTGYSVEIASRIIERAGYRPVFLDQPWERGLRSMQIGTLHYMTNMSKTPERSEYIEWIGPVYLDEMVLVVSKDNKNLPITSLDDLVKESRARGMKYGYQSGVFYSHEFETRMKNDPEFADSFEAVSKGELNYLKVANGRILGFFESRIATAYQIRHLPAYRRLAIHPFALSGSELYHGISRAGVDDSTLAQLREAHRQLESEGEIQKIIEQYY